MFRHTKVELLNEGLQDLSTFRHDLNQENSTTGPGWLTHHLQSCLNDSNKTIPLSLPPPATFNNDSSDSKILSSSTSSSSMSASNFSGSSSEYECSNEGESHVSMRFFEIVSRANISKILDNSRHNPDGPLSSKFEKDQNSCMNFMELITLANISKSVKTTSSWEPAGRSRKRKWKNQRKRIRMGDGGDDASEALSSRSSAQGGSMEKPGRRRRGRRYIPATDVICAMSNVNGNRIFETSSKQMSDPSHSLAQSEQSTDVPPSSSESSISSDSDSNADSDSSEDSDDDDELGDDLEDGNEGLKAKTQKTDDDDDNKVLDLSMPRSTSSSSYILSKLTDAGGQPFPFQMESPQNSNTGLPFKRRTILIELLGGKTGHGPLLRPKILNFFRNFGNQGRENVLRIETSNIFLFRNLDSVSYCVVCVELCKVLIYHILTTGDLIQRDRSNMASVTITPRLVNHLNKGRLRQLSLLGTADQIRKQLRNSNNSYTGRNQVEHQPAPAPTEIRHCESTQCHERGCYGPDRISHVRQLELYRQFWECGNYDLQSTALIHLMTKEAHEQDWQYYIPNENGSRRKVCRRTFMDTFSVTKHRLSTLQQKAKLGIFIPTDRRGTHETRPKRHLPEDTEMIVQHILSFEPKESHYRRSTGDPLRMYLPADLTVAKMFENFRRVHAGVQVGHWKDLYYRTFRERRFRFGEPRNDTCEVCEVFKVKIMNINYANDNAEGNLEAIMIAQQKHHYEAESGYKAMRDSTALSKESTSHVTICVDLEKTLQTPQLTNAKWYYAKKLKVYNLGITDCATNDGYMYLWSERTSKKGSDEVASCIWHHVRSRFSPLVSGEERILTLYMDNCGGQNKNINVIKLCQFLIRRHYCSKVNLEFLPVGHTFMPCDRQFALIESRKKATENVFYESAWEEIISQARPSRPFIVINMQQPDFYSFTDVVLRTPNTFKIQKYCSIHFTSEEPTLVKAKLDRQTVDFTIHIFRNGHFDQVELIPIRNRILDLKPDVVAC